MKPTISLCMIVKNEQEHLAACLDSVKYVTDEIVVVDTGSLDNTIEIARSCGARVVSHAWEGNFSIPRNLSLDHAQGEWVLILDADEKLEEDDRNKLAEVMKVPNASGYRLLIELHPEWTEMKSLRLFKNSPALRFKGVFHEELQIPQEMRKTFHDADLKIIHKPWSQDDFNKKLTRNTDMLKKHIALYPDSVYQRLDLIRLHLTIGQLTEAEALLDEVHALIMRRDRDEKKYAFYLTNYYMYRLKFLAVGAADDHSMLSLCEQALVTAPSCPLFLFEAAQRYYKLHEYDTAIGYFQKCLEFGAANNFDRSIIFPRYMMGCGALSGLGYCFFRKKKYPDAMRYFGESYALKSDKNIQAMLLSSEILGQRSQPFRDSGTSV